MNDTIETRPFCFLSHVKRLVDFDSRCKVFPLFKKEKNNNMNLNDIKSVEEKFLFFEKIVQLAKKRRFDYTGDVAEPTEKSRTR